MSSRYRLGIILCAVLSTCSPAARMYAADASERFARGYYLQTHDRDFANAAKQFEAVAGDASAAESLRGEAALRLEQCNEDVRSADLAGLMPPDAIAYLEVERPGAHIAQVAQMLGLIHQPGVAVPGSATAGAALGGPLFMPEDFAISPALVDELGRFKGIAVAITSFVPGKEPEGLAVIHPGDSNWLRGILETGVQVLKPGEPIGGYKTYQAEKAWIAKTSRLLIVSPSRDLIAGAISRLKDSNAESLAGQGQMKRLHDDRKGALLYAFVDGQRLTQALAPQMRGRDAAIAKTVLDIEHLSSISAALRTTEGSIELEAKIALNEGQRNLVYGLLRTAPLSKRSLEHVPAGVAALAVFGLNQPDKSGSMPRSGEAAEAITAMDLGRELFANVEEITLFALPPDGPSQRPPMPHMGVVLAVKDAGKSEALWNQILALAALFGAPAAESGKEVSIEGHAGKEYRIAGGPSIQLVRLEDRTLIAGTPGSVSASLAAKAKEQSVAADPQFRKLLARLTPDTSKAILVHAGRAAQFAGPGGARDEHAMQIHAMLDELVLSLVTNETPTELVVRAAATGLPNATKIVGLMAASRQNGHGISRSGLPHNRTTEIQPRDLSPTPPSAPVPPAVAPPTAAAEPARQ